MNPMHCFRTPPGSGCRVSLIYAEKDSRVRPVQRVRELLAELEWNRGRLDRLLVLGAVFLLGIKE